MLILCQMSYSQNLWQKIKGLVNPAPDTTYIEQSPEGLILIPFSTLNWGQMSFSYTDTVSGLQTDFLVKSPAVINVGPSISHRGMSFSYGFRLNHSQFSFKDLDLDFSAYGQRMGANIFLSTSEQSKIGDLNDKLASAGMTNSIKTSRMQAGVYMVIRHEKFSMPAAFNQSKRQKKSGGSPIIGLSVSNTLAILHESNLPASLDTILTMPCTFKHFRFSFFGVNGGYGFNGVTKHWLFHVSEQISVPLYTQKKMVLVDGSRVDETMKFEFTTKTRVGTICSIGKHHQIVLNAVFNASYMAEETHYIQDFFMQVYLGYRWRIK